MSERAFEALDLPRTLAQVAGRAASGIARDRILALRPSISAEAASRELARVEAVVRFVEERPEWGMPPVPDVRSTLARLAADGAVMEPLELHSVGVLLASSRAVARELDGLGLGGHGLAALRARLVEDREAERAIERTVDADGAVLDTASSELKGVRARLRGAHSRVVRRLEAYLRALDERFVVPDASVSIREGRYVVPLRREGRRAVGGIVHDESQSGATLFVEPPVAIELTNEIRSLEREEAREVRRVLGALSSRLAPLRADLAGSLDALADFDSLHARARTALAWGGEVPEMVEPGRAALALVGARHPLLFEAAGAARVVPYDLSVEPGERALVVSGPNAGGKSVFLKATGLIAALAQSGVVPPVGAGTRLPAFGAFFADIGDEQSIARSLSTFSAHLVHLREIVEEADERSLVLVDELGGGTDPAEGAALARGFLEEVVARGAFAIVTSHLGELKRLDTEGSGIVNASLEFDPGRMEPTYRLVKGRPGRSYGLAIARRLGFPDAVLDRAEAYRSGREEELDELLARLEARELEVERLAREAAGERERARRLQEELGRRERAVEEAERTARVRAVEEARRELLEARSEVERAIAEVRAAAGSGAEALDDAVAGARRRVEEAVRRRRDRGGRAPDGADAPPELSEGDRVRVRATGACGRVVELRAERALVEAGAIRLTVRAADLERLPDGDEAGSGRRRGGRGWTAPAGADEVLTEVDLRGLRVDEVDLVLARALDRALLEDLAELRIIHGKGTGALRRRVGELLEEDGRVRERRPGGPTQGGAGVTVAVLREG